VRRPELEERRQRAGPPEPVDVDSLRLAVAAEKVEEVAEAVPIQKLGGTSIRRLVGVMRIAGFDGAAPTGRDPDGSSAAELRMGEGWPAGELQMEGCLPRWRRADPGRSTAAFTTLAWP
jgi:hypothetical protein